MFISFKKNDTTSDSIKFIDISQGKVLGHGKIAITTEYSISKVLIVESIDYNLLFVSQLCEMNYSRLFTNKGGTQDIFKKFDMDKAKPIKTHMGTNGHFDLDMGEKWWIKMYIALS
jgi:hypothetical protein